MRSSDLTVQAIAAVVIVCMATGAAILPPSPALSGDALAGLYAGALGYIFGVVPGAIASRNGIDDDRPQHRGRP